MAGLNRRDLLRLLAAAPLAAGFTWTEAEASAAGSLAQAARTTGAPGYTPTFFTAHEFATVRVLAVAVDGATVGAAFAPTGAGPCPVGDSAALFATPDPAAGGVGAGACVVIGTAARVPAARVPAAGVGACSGAWSGAPRA